jgi:hypothetical protein
MPKLSRKKAQEQVANRNTVNARMSGRERKHEHLRGEKTGITHPGA